jgi:hypothetical protein
MREQPLIEARQMPKREVWSGHSATVLRPQETALTRVLGDNPAIDKRRVKCGIESSRSHLERAPLTS